MLVLKLDSGEPFDLDAPNSGVYVQQFDPGYPEVREVMENATDRDGAVDETRFVGARVVSIDAKVVPLPGQTRWAILSRLRRFCHPGQRPTLTYQEEPGAPLKMLRLRADALSAPLTRPDYAEVGLQWKSAEGAIYAASERTETITLAGHKAMPGRRYDRPEDVYHAKHPRHYPHVEGGIGESTIYVGGDMETPPLLRVWGPCKNPRIFNEPISRWPIGANLTLGRGEYLDFDVAERSVTRNGTDDRYQDFDFEGSRWWRLVPGPNTIRLSADEEELSAPITLTVTWRDAYL